jgi:hypothetical protein
MSSTSSNHRSCCEPAEPAVRCPLIEQGSYREQLALTPLASRQGHFDLRVTAWLDDARQPLGQHVRWRTTLDRQALERLHQALGALLGSDAPATQA